MKKTSTKTENGFSIRGMFRSGILMMLLILSINGFGQLQSNQWALPPNKIGFNLSGINSNTSLPIPTTNTIGSEYGGTNCPSINAQWASNSYYDASGNLQFFIVDDNLYDGSGYFIDQLKFEIDPQTNVSRILGGEISIVPVPGNAKQFFIIIGVGYYTESNGGVNEGPRFHPEYGKLDFDLPNNNYGGSRQGAMVYYSTATNDIGTNGINMINLYNQTGGDSYDPYDFTLETAAIAESNRFGLAVTPYRCDDSKYFLFISGYSHIFRYNVDATGINFDGNNQTDFGIADPLTLGLGSSGNNNFYTELEIIKLSGSYRLAKVYGDDYIVVDDISLTDGTLIPNTQKIFNIYPVVSSLTAKYTKGLEFAPSGNTLFYTYENYDNSGGSSWNNVSGYIDIPSLTFTDFTFNPNYWDDQNIGPSQIELGFDGNMYYTNGTYIKALNGFKNSPNGPASNWNGFTNATNQLAGNPLIPSLIDQIDGQNYSLPVFSGVQSCCLSNLPVSSYRVHTSAQFPNTTQVWTIQNNPFGFGKGTPTNPVIITDKLEIPAGYNITIKGMRFEFKPRTYFGNTPIYGAKTTIENSVSGSGGHLFLTDDPNYGYTTVFTSYEGCGTGMWEGIEVWGNNGAFTYSKTAWLTLYNSTEISNAYYGVTLGNKDLTYAPINSTVNTLNGGRITSQGNATNYIKFLNNMYDLFCPPAYTPTTGAMLSSTLYYTLFQTDHQLHYSTSTPAALVPTPIAHAFLNGIANVLFRSSTFNNDINNSGYSNNAITTAPLLDGIIAKNSNLVVKSLGGYPGCIFRNLKWAISGVSFLGSTFATIDQNQFTNNYRGVYLENAYNTPSVTRNHFDIKNNNTPFDAIKSYGLYLNQCTAYKVEDNAFFPFTGGVNNNTDIGIVVYNSNLGVHLQDFNHIYHNYFSTLGRGIQTQGVNGHRDYVPGSGFSNQSGLRMECNTFTSWRTDANSSFDIGVVQYPTGNLTSQIYYLQGDNATPMGNCFSQANDHTYGHDYTTWSTSMLDVNSWVQYWYDNLTIPVPCHQARTTDITPVTIGSNPINSNTITNACLSSFGTGTGGWNLSKSDIELRTDINNFQSKMDSLNVILNGGNADALYTAINDSTLTASTIKDSLLAKSPFLSDGVLIAAIKSNPLSGDDVKDIIIANSPVTQQVKDSLNTINLSATNHALIDSVQTGVSARQMMNYGISNYQFDVAIRKNDMLRNINNKATYSYKLDSLIGTQKEFADSTDDRSGSLASLYIEKGDYTKVDSITAIMDTTAGKENIGKMFDLYKNMKQNGLSLQYLISDSTELYKVRQVANDTTKDGYLYAIRILEELFGNVYLEPIGSVPDVSEKSMSHSNSPIVTKKQQYSVIYPNPNSGQFQLDYKLNEGETGELKIMDVTGRLIAKYNLVDTQTTLQINQIGLDEGIYLYQVLTNGQFVNANKLIIVK